MQYNSHMSEIQTCQLFGWRWVRTSQQSVVQQLFDWVRTSEKNVKLVATGNPEQVMLGRQNQDFFETVKNEFDLLLPDGEGIVQASRILAGKLKQSVIRERIAGVSVVEELLKKLDAGDGPVMLIGGRRYEGLNVVTRSKQWQLVPADESTDQKPGQKVSGSSQAKSSIFWLSGYQDAQRPTEAEEAEVARELQKLKPRLVFVSLGAPQQEFWAASHRQLLQQSGVRVVLMVGGAFDMLTGIIPRAPLLVRQLKLEWFWRLIQEPSRWRRQINLVRFCVLVLSGAMHHE